jgi:hypothetical protein
VNYHIETSRDGKEVFFRGVDWSTGGKPITVAGRSATHIACHFPGGSYWASAGVQKYGPAMYRVFSLVKPDPGGTARYMEVREVIEFPVTRKKS